MRKSVLLFCCSLALALGACSDDVTSPFGNDCSSNEDCARGGVCVGGICIDGSTDAGTDTPTLDVGLDSSDDTGTGTDTGTDAGPTCSEDLQCVRATDCAGTGLQNPQCIDGCCEAGSMGGPACSGHLDECSSDTQTTDDFICDTEAGVCLQRCDFDSADDTQSADCPLNSYCLAELTVDDPLALNGACLPGDCDSNIFDADACGGTGTCFPVGNGASYCIDGGTAGVDDACNQSDSDTPPASDICSPGLLCFQGTCIEPCNLRDGDSACDGDVECVQAFDITQRNQPGVCGVECTAFSGEECGGGQQCSLISGRFAINAWMCLPTGDATIITEAGESCAGDNTICAEGLICVGTDDAGGAECLSICDPAGDSEETFGSCPAEGDVCTPSALNGFGFCNEACEPYPRRPGEYDCDADGDTCLPFVSTDEEPVEPQGFCSEDEGDTEAYGDCDNAGFLGAPCEDFAVCLEVEEGGQAQCLPLCEPFGESTCGDDATCSGIPPLVGQLNFSFCLPGAQAGNIGDRCTEEGLPCAADHSICLDMGSGPTCAAVCREGFDDCSEVGGECQTGGLNPDVVPTYMGLCL